MKFSSKFLIIVLTLAFSIITHSLADDQSKDFYKWLDQYKKNAIQKGISQNTIDITFKNVKFLENVIKYDRKQPEFFEDTLTYVSKRATISRAKKATTLYIKNKLLFDRVEEQFDVKKQLLLSLWGIETNFGKHVGKMDIISSLATLSFDKRRRDFFSSQLFILLQLIDKKLILPETLYGSWAGAFGNFQFMPSTINNYAIDFDKNNKIELKFSLEDSVASAANYISKIGWKNDQPCFYRVKLTKKIKKKLFNFSAKKLTNKLTISKWSKMGVTNIDGSSLKTNFNAALIMPDGKEGSPTYLVFDNYEKILKWNRSLRFAISVCTLSDKIKI